MRRSGNGGSDVLPEKTDAPPPLTRRTLAALRSPFPSGRAVVNTVTPSAVGGSMSRIAFALYTSVAAFVALAAPGRAGAGLAEDAAAARRAEEDAYCADDIRMVENRRKLFQAS